MSESEDDEALIKSKGKKAHRGLFTQKPKTGFGMFGYDSDDDDNSMYDSEDNDSESEDEANAFNNNNAFNQPVYQQYGYGRKKTAKKATMPS